MFVILGGFALCLDWFRANCSDLWLALRCLVVVVVGLAGLALRCWGLALRCWVCLRGGMLVVVVVCLMGLSLLFVCWFSVVVVRWWVVLCWFATVGLDSVCVCYVVWVLVVLFNSVGKFYNPSFVCFLSLVCVLIVGGFDCECVFILFCL